MYGQHIKSKLYLIISKKLFTNSILNINQKGPLKDKYNYQNTLNFPEWFNLYIFC